MIINTSDTIGLIAVEVGAIALFTCVTWLEEVRQWLRLSVRHVVGYLMLWFLVALQAWLEIVGWSFRSEWHLIGQSGSWAAAGTVYVLAMLSLLQFRSANPLANRDSSLLESTRQLYNDLRTIPPGDQFQLPQPAQLQIFNNCLVQAKEKYPSDPILVPLVPADNNLRYTGLLALAGQVLLAIERNEITRR